jgi:GntR family transcriptional regulator
VARTPLAVEPAGTVVVIIRIDHGSSVAPYDQVRQQVTDMVVTGHLPAETRLPPIRQLAADLGLAPGTVARAYRELEADGVVVSRGRRGTFTRAPEQLPVPVDRDDQLAEAARAFAVRARQLQVDEATALEVVRRALASVVPDTGESATG